MTATKPATACVIGAGFGGMALAMATSNFANSRIVERFGARRVSHAALLTYLLSGVAPTVQCVTYGCPSCVDAATSDLLKDRVLSVVLHDDVISRITPQSIR